MVTAEVRELARGRRSTGHDGCLIVGVSHLEYRSRWRDDGDHEEPVSSERTEWEPRSSEWSSGPGVTRVTFHERRADGRRGNGSGGDS